MSKKQRGFYTFLSHRSKSSVQRISGHQLKHNKCCSSMPHLHSNIWEEWICWMCWFSFCCSKADQLTLQSSWCLEKRVDPWTGGRPSACKHWRLKSAQLRRSICCCHLDLRNSANHKQEKSRRESEPRRSCFSRKEYSNSMYIFIWWKMNNL